MAEAFFKPSFLLFSRNSLLQPSFHFSLSSSHGLSPFSNLLSSSIRPQVRWTTSSPKTQQQTNSTRKHVYPELDQLLKKPKKFDPITNMNKFPDDDFDFDSLRYQKPDEATDPEEFEEDEKERNFRKIQKQKAKTFSAQIDFGTDVTVKRWTENSYNQLLDALSARKKNVLITKASLIALKTHLKKGEDFTDLRREVYKYGKHKQRDYNFQRNFPHTFSHKPDDILDQAPLSSEPTPIQVKTIMADLGSEDPVSDFPFFKLPPAQRLPNGGTYAVGRRKAAVARCYLTEGVGTITVNGRPLDEYFRFDDRRNAMRPLTLTETEHFFDLRISLVGGGTTGQADAVKFAISRCILKYDPQYWWVLHGDRLLHGDRRRVEPKKYGRHKARRGNQWVKR